MSGSEGSAYISAERLDTIAKESATESCIRCSRGRRWKTAALMYETPQWDYFYCYECSHWFRRNFKFRYVVVQVDDKRLAESLASQVDFSYDMMLEPLRTITRIKAKLAKLWRLLSHW